MIIPTVTNVNRPNTILMAGAAAMSPRFFFSISDQKIKSFWRDLWTVFAEGKEKKRGALIEIFECGETSEEERSFLWRDLSSLFLFFFLIFLSFYFLYMRFLPSFLLFLCFAFLLMFFIIIFEWTLFLFYFLFLNKIIHHFI